MARSVVLVHGAFLGPWAWDGVVAELADQGVTAQAVALASRSAEGSLERDARVVRDAVEQLALQSGQPVVLVGQSYAGMVITQASADLDAVGHLVYVCAALPHEGDSVGSLMETDPHPTRLGEGIRPTQPPMARLDPDVARAVPGHDVPPAVMDQAVPQMGEHQLGTFGEQASAFGWREHPSTYLVTTLDTVFSPDLQRRMAAAADDVGEISASHFPMLSQPVALAGALAAVAQR